MTVQIVRFKDGLDVICDVDYKDLSDKVEIFNPMLFEIRNMNLVLQQWLPLAVMKGNSVVINSNEILCTMDPNDEFSEYYEKTIKKMETVISNTKQASTENDLESIEEMMKQLIEMESTKNITKH